MAQHIRTKWHKIAELVQSGDAFMSIKPHDDGPALQFSEDSPVEYNRQVFWAFYNVMKGAPRFVIDTELIEIATKEEFQDSLLAMKRGGVMRLPYPIMVVEYEKIGGIRDHNMVLLADMRDPKAFATFAGVHKDTLSEVKGKDLDVCGFTLTYCEGTSGTFLAIAPSLAFLGIEFGPDGKAWLQVMGCSNGIIKVTPQTEKYINECYVQDAGPVFVAMTSALLLMSTSGVTKEVIDTTKVNRKRDGVTKPFIPTHTYVRIGHVYRSASSDRADEYIPRKSPRPHWRRGHLRNIRIGKGRTGTKEVYIHPRLVAYHGPDNASPTPGEYHVVK